MYIKRIINIGEGDNQISIDLKAIKAIIPHYGNNMDYALVLKGETLFISKDQMPRESLLSMWKDYLERNKKSNGYVKKNMIDRENLAMINHLPYFAIGKAKIQPGEIINFYRIDKSQVNERGFYKVLYKIPDGRIGVGFVKPENLYYEVAIQDPKFIEALEKYIDSKDYDSSPFPETINFL